MGICSAFNCTSRSKPGITLHRFPLKDKERLEKWKLICRRSNNWEPNENSLLCALHFEDDQFEQYRKDGLKKLRWKAVPTLFADTMNKKDESISRHTPGRKRVLPARFRDSSENENTSLRKREGYIKTSRSNSSENENTSLGKKNREGYIETSRINSPVTVKESNGKGKESIYLEQPGGSWCLLEVCADKDQSKKDYVPTESEKELYFVGGKQSTAYEEVKHSEERKKLKSVMIEKNKLNKEVIALRQKLKNLTKGLERFLNSDQIKALMDVKGNSEQTWSRETITRAKQIQLICGCGGYEFLRDNGYPLPSSEHLEVDESVSP